MSQKDVDKIIERALARIDKAKSEIQQTRQESKPRTERALAELRRAGLLRD